MYALKTEHSFDAAHFLTDYDGKCENLHGHRWRVVVYIEAEDLQAEGVEKDMVVDFGAFKKTVRRIVNEFDHMFIVEEGSLAPETMSALESETFRMIVVPWRTTSENFARYFCERFCAEGLPVSQVEVYETPLNCAIYRP